MAASSAQRQKEQDESGRARAPAEALLQSAERGAWRFADADDTQRAEPDEVLAALAAW